MKPPPTHLFKATERFWAAFYALPEAQKKAVRAAWQKFKINPFDPSLGTHKIHALSARTGKTVYSTRIDENLRVVFIIEHGAVISFDLGTHAIYR